MQPVPSVGKHATGAKRGKNVKLMPNMRRVTSTGKHESVPSAGKLITSAKQGKTVGCGFAPEVVNQTE